MTSSIDNNNENDDYTQYYNDDIANDDPYDHIINKNTHETHEIHENNDNNNNISNGSNEHEDECTKSTFQPLQVLCEVNGFIIPAIIDTGAQISIMSASCAKRCRVSSNIDSRYAGKAIGVGTSEIIGRINQLDMRIGPVSFKNDISILREASVDFLIGMDFLRRFRCEVSFNDNILRLQVKGRRFRVPLVTGDSIITGGKEFFERTVAAEESDNEMIHTTSGITSTTGTSKPSTTEVKTNKSHAHMSIYEDDIDDAFDGSMSLEGV